MKHFFLMALILCSLDGYSDQSDILAQGRDHLIDQAIEKLKNYCADLPVRSVDSTYICRLQVEEDCSRSSEKQKQACAVLAKVKDLENKISITNESVAQIAPLPLYSTKPVIKQNAPEESAPIDPAYRGIKVSRGSTLHGAPRTTESLRDSQQLDDMIKKINTYKIRVDCSVDSECKVQNYGKRICGGPTGTFVYSERGEDYKVMQEEISKFNEADEAFIKNWNKDMLGTCDWRGRTEPAKCIENTCS